jgi:hypothetical protein
MKKNLIVIALLAALMVVFAGCTEANSSFDAEGYLTSAIAYPGAHPSTFNPGDCEATMDASGVITVNGSAGYKNLFTIAFPGAAGPGSGTIPAGVTNVVIDYVCVIDGGTMKLTTKQGYDGEGYVPAGDADLNPATYSHLFKEGLNQLEIPVARFDKYKSGVSFENNNSAQAWRIKILGVSFN